jgi:hypothetical protein
MADETGDDTLFAVVMIALSVVILVAILRSNRDDDNG